MAVVHAAHHELLDEPVALKMLYADVARIPEATTRFLHEAKIAARIKSPNVCRILDVGVAEDGAPYIAMERLDGMNLDDLIEARRTFAITEAVDLVVQVLHGVEAAHALGVVHRDLKPANLVVCEGASGPIVKIVDFGVSKSGLLSELTVAGAMLGSPTHMSPEQIHDSRSVDARADIWAIGVILYELLTGALPFDGVTTGDVLARILEEPPAPLHTLRPDIPAALDAIVLKCLRSAREERFACASDLREALAPFATRAPQLRSIPPWTQSHAPEQVETPMSPTRAGLRQAIVACAVVVLVGTAALLTLALHLSPDPALLSSSGIATSGTIDRSAGAGLEPTSALVPLEDAGAAVRATPRPTRIKNARTRRDVECPDAFICSPTY
ncbi:MAG: Protein kinase [Myxococcaceae bacterium]|nr:Protein kinase [Myxococcaceae bacterium]